MPAHEVETATAKRRVLVRAADAQIDVTVDGEAGASIVLLPSSLRDSEDFDDLARRIASAGFVVLRPQPRGMGESRGPMEDLTLEVLARDVALVIEKLGGGRSIILGHAFGHYVARVVDLNHRARVRGLVLAAAAAKEFPPHLAESLAIAADTSAPRTERLQHLQRPFFAPGNDSSSWLQGWHPQLRAAYGAASAKPSKDVWWPVTNAPILELQAAEDPWRPPASRLELKEVLGEKVSVQVIARASHALIPEQSGAVAQTVIQWITGLAP
ncbi:MAG TPA: alpha/beta hydrolase [Burkholderiaceae bacterium]|nr:alpha/beta hydrolase [Burkholderiaceae bacterium]